MAYYFKVNSYASVRLLLAKRFGDGLVAKRDALVREARAAGSSAYNPNPDPIFEIEDVTDKVASIPTLFGLLRVKNRIPFSIEDV